MKESRERDTADQIIGIKNRTDQFDLLYLKTGLFPYFSEHRFIILFVLFHSAADGFQMVSYTEEIFAFDMQKSELSLFILTKSSGGIAQMIVALIFILLVFDTGNNRPFTLDLNVIDIDIHVLRKQVL